MNHEEYVTFESEQANADLGQTVTLRDYFAARALIGLLRSGCERADLIAADAYRMADEMLAARK